MRTTTRMLVGALVVLVTSRATADLGDVAGVMGMTPVLEDWYAAIWVPVPEGQAIAGVRWYNNDETVVFPALLVASGLPDRPIGIDEAILTATNVRGISSGWSTVAFSEPYACHGTGLYCLLVFPEGSEYETRGIGGGAGIGYVTRAEGREGWLCADAETCTRIDGEFGLAIEPVLVPALPGMVLLSRAQPAQLQVIAVAQLSPPFPNPFNPQTMLMFRLPETQKIELAVFDLNGRLVRTLAGGECSAGDHSVIWRGEDDLGRRVASGVYVARFVAGNVTQNQRVVLLK